MRHRLVRWHQQYVDRGLVIIEIDGGEFEPLELVKQSIDKQKGLEHLVLWDKERQNHNKYGVTAWPTAYLVGADGRVVWEGSPARVVSRPELVRQLKKLIETELGKAKNSKRKITSSI